MWKIAIGSVLVLMSLILMYEAWANWADLTKWATFLVGLAIGACLAAGLLVLMWRPDHPATRYQASLPSPWERKRWR